MIIEKIDNKLKEDELSEETIATLKKTRRTIFTIISPPNRFEYIESEFIDSMIKTPGKWVILDGIEMAPTQIQEKMAPLYGEISEINTVFLLKYYSQSRKY